MGALVATRLASHAYTETHLTTLRQLGNLIAPFIQNTILLHRERELAGASARSARSPRCLGTSLDARDVFGRLAAAVKPILDFDRMAALLISPSGRDLELLAAAGMPDSRAPGADPAGALLLHAEGGRRAKRWSSRTRRSSWTPPSRATGGSSTSAVAPA